MSSLLFPEIKKPQPLHQSHFHKDNMKNMRDKEENMKERVIEIHRHAQQPEWKMKQFQNVDSKV